MKLLRGDGPLLKVGHRGAAALAPANTIAAVEAALEHGVDFVEIDVNASGGRLVLGHSRRELGPEPVLLDEMLALLADLKISGHDRQLVDALRAHGLVERTLACTNHAPTLNNLRAIEPALARSRTYPRGHVYFGRRRTRFPIRGPVLWALKKALPHRVEHLTSEVDARAMTLGRPVVTKDAVERCHELGIAVFVWTVNRAELVRDLGALGVDGVITDDPRVLAG